MLVRDSILGRALLPIVLVRLISMMYARYLFVKRDAGIARYSWTERKRIPLLLSARFQTRKYDL